MKNMTTKNLILTLLGNCQFLSGEHPLWFHQSGNRVEHKGQYLKWTSKKNLRLTKVTNVLSLFTGLFYDKSLYCYSCFSVPFHHAESIQNAVTQLQKSKITPFSAIFIIIIIICSRTIVGVILLLLCFF